MTEQEKKRLEKVKKGMEPGDYDWLIGLAEAQDKEIERLIQDGEPSNEQTIGMFNNQLSAAKVTVAKLRKQLRYVLEVRGIECLHKHPGPDDACARCTSEKLLANTEAK